MTGRGIDQIMVRTWLDWMLALPWSKLGSGAIDLAAASRVLDEDHSIWRR